MEGKQTSIAGPLVSIGVPVYNDAPWLRNSLNHLLAQDYYNLEIVIADDGSTDGSREICREYARRDTRIRLFENKHNLKALGNHKFVFDVSTGDYFAWGSGHDYYHVSFVSKTLENLLANSSAIMCCTQSSFVDEKGVVLRTTLGGLNTRGLPPAERFRKLMEHTTRGGTANIFFGLYRHDVLGQKDFFRQVSGWDIIMLGELSLLGEMTQVNEILHYRMMNHKESNREHSERHTEMLFNKPGFIPERFLYHFAASKEFLNMAWNTELSTVEKQKLYEDIVELDINMGRVAISNEIDHLLAYSKTELNSLKLYPQSMQYRAAQILNVLEQARVLGFCSNDMNVIKSICLSALKLDGEARIAIKGEKYKNVHNTPLGWLDGKIRKILHRIKSLVSRTKRTSA